MSKRAILSKIRSFKPFSKKSNLGFTLIELLIAVTIIAILVSVGAVSFTRAQAKGRDSQRLSDLQEIRSALEMYYAENGSYPTNNNPECDYAYCYSGSPDPITWLPGLEKYFSDENNDGVANDLPIDPGENSLSSYVYRYIPTGPSVITADNRQSYLLFASLETSSDEPNEVDGTFYSKIPNMQQYNNCRNLINLSGWDPPDCVIYVAPSAQH